jgi:hypothetical protein
MVPVEAWPFAPGDVVRDSGEDGDDTAWLDAAPVGVHVVDRYSNPWRRFPKGWASPKATGDGSGAPSDYLASRGPITVTSLAAARPTAPATPAAGPGTSGVATGAQGGAGEVGLGVDIRGLGTHASVPTEYAEALADRADALEEDLRFTADRANLSEASYAQLMRERTELQRTVDSLTDEATRQSETIGRVRALHQHDEDPDDLRCIECGTPWPCTTSAALDGTQ